MIEDNQRLMSLSEIEGAVSPHQGFVEREMQRRKEALEYVDDVPRLAEYIGGEVEHQGTRNWTIKKEAFPGVNIHFAWEQRDEEFPSSLKVFYSGERVKMVSGENLASLVIAYANHILDT
jgi:hypothetical protein